MHHMGRAQEFGLFIFFFLLVLLSYMGYPNILSFLILGQSLFAIGFLLFWAIWNRAGPTSQMVLLVMFITEIGTTR
jgi:hypothetical protein